MVSRLFSLMRKEFLQFLRDKMLVILILYTFVEPILCGVSLFMDVKYMSFAVYDGDRTTASRALIDRLARSEHFNLTKTLTTPDDVRTLLDNGQVQMALVIPAGFAQDLDGGKTVPVQLIADGSNANIAAQAMGYAQRIVGEYSRKIELERLGLPASVWQQLPVVVNQIKARFDPDMRFTTL